MSAHDTHAVTRLLETALADAVRVGATAVTIELTDADGVAMLYRWVQTEPPAEWPSVWAAGARVA